MKTISLLDFRLDAKRILARIQKGERMVITRRGKPVARLEPIAAETSATSDPFYSLTDLAVTGDSLDNAQVDDLLYGK